MNTSATKPSESSFIREILDQCPETKEPQTVQNIYSDDESVFIETRGESTAWKHRIFTEEISLNNQDQESR